MSALVISFIISASLTFLILHYGHLHDHISADHDLLGVQKFHSMAVPRVGGISVFLGVSGAMLYGLITALDDGWLGVGIVLCGSIAFIVGLLEDLTKKVGVKERLLATAVSGLCGGYFLGGWLVRVDVPGVDYLMVIPLFSILITSVAISGVANAYNIIDGYNGLTGVVSVMVLLGTAYVAHQAGDAQLVWISLGMVGSIAGFLIWNFPRGLIFLGDGGAYFVGFMIAELSVLLIIRNESVSPWFPLLINFYPIFETFFSAYRKIRRKMSPGQPDGLHLHMLIYRRVVRLSGIDSYCGGKVARNALTSPYLWVLSGFAIIPAILFWRSSLILFCFTVVFALIYMATYRKIVRCRLPKWIILRNFLKSPRG